MLDRSKIREILDSQGLAPQRSLGQNFVADQLVIDRIVDLAGIGATDHVLEIGPGLGSLTCALVATGAEVVALEKDAELVSLLEQNLVQARAFRSAGAPPEGGADTTSEDLTSEPNVALVTGDALEVDLDALLCGQWSWKMVANLPYNVAVPIVLRVLAEAPQVAQLHVMVQREVADRLCARPGGRTIGLPTLRLNWWAEAAIVMDVPPTAFEPVPNVDSAVVRIVRSKDVPRADERAVMGLAQRAYQQRRKMLRVSLRDLDPEVFDAAGIDPTSRPEQLSLGQWIELSEAVGTAKR